MPIHRTIKEWDQNWREIDIMYQKLNVPQRGDFSTIQKKIVAHKHEGKNKIDKPNYDFEWTLKKFFFLKCKKFLGSLQYILLW